MHSSQLLLVSSALYREILDEREAARDRQDDRLDGQYAEVGHWGRDGAVERKVYDAHPRLLEGQGQVHVEMLRHGGVGVYGRDGPARVMMELERRRIW